MLALPVLLLALQASKLEPTVLSQLKAEAAAVGSLIDSKLAKDWLSGVDHLQEPEKRVVYRTPDKEYLSEAAWKALPEKDQVAARKVELSPDFYYYTKYGTPLAYVRVWDLAAKNGLTD